MSPATVRHHLALLLADGRIALIGKKRSNERGRPMKLYGLSEKSLGDNLALLSDVVLEKLLEDFTPAKRDETINEIARKLALHFGEDNSNAQMVKRLTVTVEKLNELHYQASWEAGAQGPRLLFANCPYAAIIAKHPELCSVDAAMISAATNKSARQISKMKPDTTMLCIFVLDQVS